MPTYMENFRCKCDACRAVCCRGWRIHLTKTEYLRLTALACSDSLRARIERSLTVFDAPSEDAFAYIAHGEDGRCPMLDGDGLCTLQTECGDTIQPAVCRLYPRAVRAGDPCEIVAATSCEATVELLMKEPCPLPFTEITGEISSEIPPHEIEHEDERAWRQACLSFFGEAETPLPVRIREIGDFLGAPPCDMTDHAMLTLAQRLLLAFGREGNSISDLTAQAMDALAMRDGVTEESLSLFRGKVAAFRARFPEADRWYANLLSNHFFFMKFPPRDLSHAESFFVLRGVSAILFVLTVCHTDKFPTEEAFADAAAATFRRIEHSGFYEIAPHLHAEE